ncbi:MAG TPA: efflux RND transporter periplasmic adaptor subunit [Thermoanaerobaculia bacterium]|jgi:HlyD family secretion protein|nr:efflux RND transporter periplasmic adaptor subunit [Thermoanaerobaculia bacterium]
MSSKFEPSSPAETAYEEPPVITAPPARRKLSRGWKIAIGVAVVVLALVALGKMQAAKAKIPRVTVAKVERQDIVSKVTANGKVQAEKKVDLSALVMGQIVNLAVREGDHVAKGDFLLQIDKNQAAAGEAGSAAALAASFSDRDSAKATMEQARRDYERARKNYQEKILAEADFQKAKSTLDTATANYQAAQNRIDQSKANLNASRDTLSKTTVRAPLSGVVTALPIKEGEVTVIGTMNNAGTQLMTVSDMSTVEAVMMVDETDVPNVKVGQKALVNIDAYPNHPFDGIVTEVGSSPILPNDPDLQGLTTTSDAINFKVRIKVLQPPDTIRPGFSVTSDIITGTKPSVLTIPLAAVVVRDSPKAEKTATGKVKTEEGVYVIDKGKVKFVPIQTGLSGELSVEVKTGLDAGRQIITGPFKALRTIKDGDKVMIEKAKKGTGPGSASASS